MNILEQFEKEQFERLMSSKSIPPFSPGDTVKVNVRIVEGTTDRIQVYEGVVIAKRQRGMGTSVLVRKISHGEGVERRFLLCSPMVQSIQVVKRGIVRRAKLYYLRQRRGKSARIREKLR